MSDLTVDQLIQTQDEPAALSALLAGLRSIGFPPTSWSPGGRAHSMLRVFARGSSKLQSSIPDLVRGGLLGFSTGPWLTLLAREWFGVERNYVADANGNLTQIGRTYAEGNVTLNVAPGAGPHTITPGASVIFESLNGRRYVSVNPSSVTLPAGPSSTVVPYRAESAGAAYNAALGQGIGFVTPLAGVTAAFTDTLGTGTWPTKLGADEENDESVRARCRARWRDALSFLSLFDAHLRVATKTPGISTPPSRIYVNPGGRGPGTTDIWLASNAGPLPTEDLVLIRARLLSKKSITEDMQVNNAVPLGITVKAHVVFRGAFVTAIEAAENALRGYVNSLPMGGKILRAQVLEEIMAIPGVVDVPPARLSINGVHGDLQLTPMQVATFAGFDVTKVHV
jgi:uncharacterized phage protein gp47/JayE